MLFTELPFFALYLPVVLVGFFTIARFSLWSGLVFLGILSLVFYGIESPKHLPLLLGSICFNFFVAKRITLNAENQPVRKRLLQIAIVVNLLVLAIFKYAGFLVSNINAIFSVQIPDPKIALPVGISFFTFTQIAFLVDHYRTRAADYDFSRYLLFVTYFPHLVAGPIIHHASVMPQLHDPAMAKPREHLICLGFAIFAIGLVKKIVFADSVGAYADAAFQAVDGGRALAMTDAWLAASAYMLQLYFDFSGYSDMAIGLSWMLGVQLPYNFNSPYKALSIADFWRRWHMTLSAFLRDYLYISLGGNRGGTLMRYRNLFLTMFIGGLWHGASWNFVFWGALHGGFLIVHQLWVKLCGHRHRALSVNPAYKVGAWLLTMLCVLLAWIYFRATTFSGASTLLSNLWFNAANPFVDVFSDRGLDPVRGAFVVATLACVATFLPNSNAIGEWLARRVQVRRHERLVLVGFALALCVFLVVVNSLRSDVSPFIYFNF